MIIFTSVCANYVHKARTLAQSVKKYIPDATMVLCLVEREIDPAIPAECFDDVVLAKDVWEGNFDQFIFKHAIVEASTSVKGQFFRYLMDKYTEENKFVYLDPDIAVYSDFVELREELDKHPIVICPHLLKPGNVDMELAATAHGVYNLGFLAVSRSDEGRRCIDWWAERLSMFCYDEIESGIFTDQMWFDLVPCFFDAKIFKHHGYDFAPWSLKDCCVTRDERGYYVNGDPLRFIHYSGFGASAQASIDKFLPKEGELFLELYEEYGKRHDENNMDGISKTPWSYANYHSGEQIDDRVRRAYRYNEEVKALYEDPFARSNEEYIRLLNVWIPDENAAAAMKRRIAKAGTILKEDGFSALLGAMGQWLTK